MSEFGRCLPHLNGLEDRHEKQADCWALGWIHFMGTVTDQTLCRHLSRIHLLRLQDNAPSRVVYTFVSVLGNAQGPVIPV